MRRPLAAELATKEALLALALLVVNDHVLKGSGLLPGWLTGKLSDFAGLFLFPLLVFVLSNAVFNVKRETLALFASGSTALGFGLVKLSPGVNAWVSSLWGPMRLDASDLIALPMTLVAGIWLCRPVRARNHSLRVVALIATALACAATSKPNARSYPEWQLETSAQRIGCARLDAWVSKSGKEGIGINLAVASSSTDTCRVEILSGSIDVGGERVPLARRPTAVNLGAPAYLYLPFPFDNEKAWNQGRRSARLELQVKTSAGSGVLESAMKHEWEGGAHAWHPSPPAPEAPDASVTAAPDQAFQLEPRDSGAWE